MPRVSVIIPTCNRARFLPGAVESAKQAGSHLEIIVVDDGSTDETPEVCRQLSGIRYIRLPHNVGLAEARNAGILASAAEIVAFLDDDDLRLPDSLDSQVRALDASPDAAFCYGQVLIADPLRQLPTGEILPRRCPAGDIFWELLEHNFIPVPSVVARRKALIEAEMFTDEKGVEDWELWLRMTESHPVVAVQEPVAVYRKPNSTSGQLSSDFTTMYKYMRSVQESALKLPRAAAAPRSRRRRARRRFVNGLYRSLLYEATAALAAGDRGAARAVAREAVLLRPLRGRADLAFLTVMRGLRRLMPGRANGSGSRVND
ncbi:MAG: glycosyltransferase family 2 protein [Acidobacteria bacterium]|nr:glycosyltransferase family 2 protein [Acidobacteriota bacterium]